MSKLKNIILSSILSLPFIFSSGCETLIKKELVCTHKYIETIYNDSYKQEAEINYNFKINQQQNLLKIRLKETKYKNTYSGKKEIKKGRFIQYNTYRDDTSILSNSFLLGTLFSGIGGIIGYFSGEKRIRYYGWYDESVVDTRPEKARIGGGIGAALGLIIGIVASKPEIKKELAKNEKPLIKTIKEGEWTLDKLAKKELIYKDKFSSNTILKISSSFFKFLENNKLKSSITKKTNKSGTLEVLLQSPENFGFTKQNLIKKIESDTLVKNIKDLFKQNFISYILNNLEQKSYSISFKVDNKVKDNTLKLKKDFYTHQIKGYEPKDDIKSLLKNYFNQKLDSSLQSINIKVISEKNLPVENAVIEVHPLPLEKILLNYFNQNLVPNMTKEFQDYEGSKIILKLTDKNGLASFRIYIPSKIKVNVFHKDYWFKKQNIDFNKSSEKTIKLLKIKK